MASAPPPSSPDVELSPPVLVSMISSSSSDTEEENVNQGFESDRGFANHGVFNWGGFSSCGSVSELSVSCFGLVMSLWFFVSMFLILGVYRPQDVWLGPNSSILFEPDSIFLQRVKVKELGDSKSGLELFGFYRTPPLDVYVNWSESRLLSVSYNSYKEWPYYFNRGTSLNITYTVKPQGSSVQLVVMEGKQGIYQSLNEPAFRNTTWSWNLIQGSGMIELEISESSSYYVAVANLKRKDIKVELDIDVRAVLYDTKQSSYKCTLSNGECTFNALSLVGSSAVLTSPSPSQGASIEEEVWYIRFSYQPRWTAYVISTGIVMCFVLVAIHLWERLQCFGGERYLTDNDSVRTRLLANKDDDGSSMGSCNESFANDDADLEEFIGKDGEASNSSRRLCGICFNAPRDCFFLPCGHCVSCYRCGKTIAEGIGSCPICRRTTKKVKRIYTA